MYRVGGRTTGRQGISDSYPSRWGRDRGSRARATKDHGVPEVETARGGDGSVLPSRHAPAVNDPRPRRKRWVDSRTNFVYYMGLSPDRSTRLLTPDA